jgi:hypothetical protein
LGQISVDNANHVITGALACHADKRDSQCLIEIADQVKENLEENNLKLNQVVTDTGYSSGETLKYCEENRIDAYIPNFGRYKPEREGFVYNKELDQYECQRGNKAVLTLRNANTRNGEHYVRRYASSREVCRNCPLRVQCCEKSTKYKKLDDSIHKEYYDRMHKKLTENKEYAKRLFRSRSSTVEPVLGTLINYLNMKRINTRGIDLATKHIIMAALAYNLRKYLKFTNRRYACNSMLIPVIKKINNENYRQFLWIYIFFAGTCHDF